MTEISKYRYIFRIVLVCGLLYSIAYVADISAYIDSRHGPIVNCNSNLPMNELLQCVNKEYKNFTPIVESKNIKIYKELLESGAIQFLPSSGIKIYRKTAALGSEFPKIKSCYNNNDWCLTEENVNGVGDRQPYDTYKDKTLAIFLGVNFTHKEEQEGGSIFNWFNSGGLSYPYYFLRSYKTGALDIILAEINDKFMVFLAHFEKIRLKDDKNLIGITIPVFFPKNPLMEGYQLSENGKVYTREIPRGGTESFGVKNLKYLFSPAVAYTFWIITDKNDYPKRLNKNKKFPMDLAISLDRRINPTKIFIKTNNKVYSINIEESELYSN